MLQKRGSVTTWDLGGHVNAVGLPSFKARFDVPCELLPENHAFGY
jgi:hypothetical protein